MSKPVARISQLLNLSEEYVLDLFHDVQKCFKGKVPGYVVIASCIVETNCEIEPQAIAKAIEKQLLQLRQPNPIASQPSSKGGRIRPNHTRSSETDRRRQPNHIRFVNALREGKYYFYRNSSYQATVHYETCSFCNNGKGAHSGQGSRWYGPFETKFQAIAKARQVIEGDVRTCDHCGAAPPITFSNYTVDL
jgi:hypothetical protein